mmetsp:Transcript_21429/g.85235  ORF Transcript_21429/g.85235 Transcript_21429/m.85235 type:complete len:454 (-) Transcript_21429:129-1490(-)
MIRPRRGSRTAPSSRPTSSSARRLPRRSSTSRNTTTRRSPWSRTRASSPRTSCSISRISATTSAPTPSYRATARISTATAPSDTLSAATRRRESRSACRDPTTSSSCRSSASCSRSTSSPWPRPICCRTRTGSTPTTTPSPMSPASGAASARPTSTRGPSARSPLRATTTRGTAISPCGERADRARRRRPERLGARRTALGPLERHGRLADGAVVRRVSPRRCEPGHPQRDAGAPLSQKRARARHPHQRRAHVAPVPRPRLQRVHVTSRGDLRPRRLPRRQHPVHRHDRRAPRPAAIRRTGRLVRARRRQLLQLVGRRPHPAHQPPQARRLRPDHHGAQPRRPAAHRHAAPPVARPRGLAVLHVESRRVVLPLPPRVPRGARHGTRLRRRRRRRRLVAVAQQGGLRARPARGPLHRHRVRGQVPVRVIHRGGLVLSLPRCTRLCFSSDGSSDL